MKRAEKRKDGEREGREKGEKRQEGRTETGIAKEKSIKKGEPESGSPLKIVLERRKGSGRSKKKFVENFA